MSDRKKPTTPGRPRPVLNVEVTQCQLYATVYLGAEKVGRIWAQLQISAERSYPGLMQEIATRLSDVGDIK